MRTNNRRHQTYVGKHSARLRFLAGVVTCLMLVTAAACVGYAVYMIVDSTAVPVQARVDVQAADTSVFLPHVVPLGGENYAPTAVVEPAGWIQIIPLREEEFEEMYEAYVFMEDDEDVFALPEVFFPVYETLELPTSLLSFEHTLLPFYIPDNSVLYTEFLHSRPDLDAETAIWMVNASVHVPFYSQITIDNNPNPLLISPSFRLPEGFTPHALVPVNNDECHLRATPQTVAAFQNFRMAARDAGFDLSVTSAYRTATRQGQLWENGGRRDGRVARPHHSEHQTGRAIDFWGPGGLMDRNGPTPVGRWAAENAHYHGFILRYRAETTHITGYIFEPWHFTFVGLEISMYMHNNNILSLEEFVGRNPGAMLPPV
ncbi:MAG: M15 family metallopeptidase [Defluviitaleaceae bacterium]|nr:M15 family metallopeptidase [Defluviitaleaceae bacterium]